MKILLFGKGGQVGWELQRSLAPLGELIALDSDSKEQCGDFTRLDRIAETVRSIAPDVIVNAAAYTAVDKAENEPELVRTINALAPGVLAQEARRLDSWLIHYSTDYPPCCKPNLRTTTRWRLKPLGRRCHAAPSTPTCSVTT